MASYNGRIVRYVLFALFAFFIVYLLTTSSIPKTHLPNNADFMRWKGRKSGGTENLGDGPINPQAPIQNANPPANAPANAAVNEPAKVPPNPPLNPPANAQAAAPDSAPVAPGAPAQVQVLSPASSSAAAAQLSQATSPANAPFPDKLVAPGDKMNATFVTLARNSDLWDIVESIRQVEDRFNRHYHYDWVFLNDNEFNDEFKKVTTALISGKTKYGKIGQEHWSFPEWIDQDKAKRVREDMAERKIIYGDSISYRHMCRFESGFFFRQPLMMDYEWYWRVEPSIKLFCDIGFDPFRYMAEHKKLYSFVISLFEYVETIPTLWDSTKKFMAKYPQYLAKDNAMKWLSEDNGETYNHCHFWSNFEIGSLNWLRSREYLDFFESLDKDGGFFYERWGDAPVHSIAAALLLNRDQIHFFEDIGYWHVPFTHCPTEEKQRLDLKCSCNPKDNFDWKGYSCTNRWFEVMNMKKPDGWLEQKNA